MLFYLSCVITSLWKYVWGHFSAVGKLNTLQLKSVVKSEANYAPIITGMCLNVAFLNWLWLYLLKMNNLASFAPLTTAKCKPFYKVGC